MMIQHVPDKGPTVNVNVWYFDGVSNIEGRVVAQDNLSKAVLLSPEGTHVCKGIVTLLPARDSSRRTTNVVFISAEGDIIVLSEFRRATT